MSANPVQSSKGSVSRFWLPDALRFPAALGVVGFHVLLTVRVQRPTGDTSAWWLGWLEYGGTFGVSLFFVLSGFGVHLGRARALAAGQSIGFSPVEFARRRFWRLYPTYLLAMVGSILLGACWAWWRGRRAAGLLPSGTDVLAHLLLLHPLFPKTFFGIVPAFWFVGVLAHLLVLYPIYLKTGERWGSGRALVAVFVITLVYRSILVFCIATGEERYKLLSNAPGRWFEWALGAELASLVAQRRTLHSAIGVAALMLVPIWLAAGRGMSILYEPVLGALFALALWWALTDERLRQARWLTWSAWTGNISYGLYLLHEILIPYISSALAHRPLRSAALFGEIFVVVLFLTLPLATVLHRWVEVPLSAKS